jgi:hypothetical protein
MEKNRFEAAKHFARPAEAIHESVDEELERLATEWRNDTAHLSSLSEMVAHHAYQRIIGKGRNAIPFLLRALQREPEHWFSALAAITGVNPVARDDEGRIRRMAQAWVTWGKEQRYI